jgi:hypothetical protein
MPAPWKKVALCSLLLLGVTTATASAQQIASPALLAASPTDPMCGPSQLSGQYECVTSAPLSSEEVRVCLAYLAALAALRVWNDEQPAPTLVAVRVSRP